uniref:Uncharacterized protein n=1 Tax=Oryza barthii TaxID=65489 RepID=A0A0D3FVV6_9ORYZ
MVARHRHTCSSSSSASFLELEQLLLSSFAISCTGKNLPATTASASLVATLSAHRLAMAFSRSMPSESRATRWLTVSRSRPSTYVPLAAVSSCSCSRSSDPVVDRRRRRRLAAGLASTAAAAAAFVFVTFRFSAMGQSAMAAGPTRRPKSRRCAATATEAAAAAPHATTRHAREAFRTALATLSFLATFPWLRLMARRMDEYLSWIRRKLLRVAASLNGLLRTAASGAVVAAAATLSETMVARKLSMDR